MRRACQLYKEHYVQIYLEQTLSYGGRWGATLIQRTQFRRGLSSLFHAPRAVAAGHAQRIRLREILIPRQAPSLAATSESTRERSFDSAFVQEYATLSRPYEAAVGVVASVMKEMALVAKRANQWPDLTLLRSWNSTGGLNSEECIRTKV